MSELITSLEQAGEGSRLLLVDLNAAPFTRTFFDALNGYATGGSGRCLETLAIWNAHLAASTPVGGWEGDPYLATDLALVNDLIYQHGGDAALAGWVRLCRRITAAPPSVSTGSRPREAVPTEQADGAVVDLREALSGLLAFTGMFTPEQFATAMWGVHGDELVGVSEVANKFDKAQADAWTALSATPQPADGCSSNEGAGE